MGQKGGTRPVPPAGVVTVIDDAIARMVVATACAARAELDLTGEARSSEEALALCERVVPDLAVVDLASRRIDGLELARRLSSAPRPPEVLGLTGLVDGGTVLAAIRAGIRGLLVRTAGTEEAARVMLAVARGERVFPPEQQRLAFQELGRLARRARLHSRPSSMLTPREVTVLEHLAEGLTLHQTGTRMGISQRTVESHVGKVYRKLDVSTRVQAVAKAISLGLIDVGRSR